MHNFLTNSFCFQTKLDGAIVRSPADRKLCQPENKKAVSESGFKMDNSTKDDKMVSKLETNAGENVEAKAKEEPVIEFIGTEPKAAAASSTQIVCLLYSLEVENYRGERISYITQIISLGYKPINSPSMIL